MNHEEKLISLDISSPPRNAVADETFAFSPSSSTSSPPPSPPISPLPPPGSRPLNVKDALSYLKMIKVNFQDKPEVYENFLDIMKDFKSQAIDTLGVIERVSNLFSGHLILVQGFNTFLPQDYYIDCTDNQKDEKNLTITTPSGTVNYTTGSSVHGLATLQDELPFSDASAPDPIPPDVLISPTISELEPHIEGRPADVDETLNYVNKVKQRFMSDPDKYRQFLELNLVFNMFNNRWDLLENFEQILPKTESAGGSDVTGDGMMGMNEGALIRMMDLCRGWGGKTVAADEINIGGGRDAQSSVLKNMDNAPEFEPKLGSSPGETTSDSSKDHITPLPDYMRPSLVSTAISHLNLEESTSALAMADTIGGTMDVSDVVSCLVQHGCKDISRSLDFSACTKHPISTGGFGDIYRGRLQNGDSVAIKCIRIYIDQDSEANKHIKYAAREIHTWAKCEHPHVLKLLGLVQFRGQIGMVSPWVTRGSLNNYVPRHPEANRLQLCVQVADGLAYLHQCGIVHGDLKGANVLVSDDGDALLTDFGNAVLQERTLKFTHTTAKQHLSLRWTAPELMEEDGTYSMEADIFALGMTILEIITGAVPYHQWNERGVVLVIARGELPKRPENSIPTMSEMGDLLWSMLIRCWGKVPKSRPVASEVKSLMSSLRPEGLLVVGTVVDIVALIT